MNEMLIIFYNSVNYFCFDRVKAFDQKQNDRSKESLQLTLEFNIHSKLNNEKASFLVPENPEIRNLSSYNIDIDSPTNFNP